MVSAADLKSIHDTVKPHYICLVEVSAFRGGGGCQYMEAMAIALPKLYFMLNDIFLFRYIYYTANIYSQTCFKGPSWGNFKSGRIRQVAFNSSFLTKSCKSM